MIFQNALLGGFKENGAIIDVIGLPIVPTFPKSKYIKIPFLKEKLESGYICTWISTINLPLIKQIERKIKIEHYIRRWKHKYKNEHKVIIVYSVFAPVFKSILSQKIDFDTLAIVTDLPKFMFTYTQFHGLKKMISYLYSKYIENLQGKMKKYVYLTDAMHSIVAPQKPYIVMEGVADCQIQIDENEADKKDDEIFSIMYAGGLNKNYGIENLLLAVMGLNYNNIELWLFGDGDAVPLIKDKQNIDCRIHYYGNVERETVLKKEKQANLLVNVRNPMDDFTRYSFPSKTLEYMLSGTMFLSTKLEGIPIEYYKYIKTINNNSVECIRNGIEEAYLSGEEKRKEAGKRAQEFVREFKNPKVQSKKILEFINY